MMKKRKLWIIFSAVFVSGILTGGAIGFFIGKGPSRPPRPSRNIIKKRLTGDLGKYVKLTEKQKTEIDRILDEHFTAMRDLFKQSRPKVDKINKEFFEKIKKQMTPEQLAGYEKFKDDLFQRMNRQMPKFGDSRSRHKHRPSHRKRPEGSSRKSGPDGMPPPDGKNPPPPPEDQESSGMSGEDAPAAPPVRNIENQEPAKDSASVSSPEKNTEKQESTH